MDLHQLSRIKSKTSLGIMFHQLSSLHSDLHSSHGEREYKLIPKDRKSRKPHSSGHGLGMVSSHLNNHSTFIGLSWNLPLPPSTPQTHTLIHDSERVAWFLGRDWCFCPLTQTSTFKAKTTLNREITPLTLRVTASSKHNMELRLVCQARRT